MSRCRLTCLCVSRAGREALLQRAILNFVEQCTSEDELVVVAGAASLDAARLQLSCRSQIRPVEVPEAQPYHEKVRHGLRHAGSDDVVFWDDDNQFRPEFTATTAAVPGVLVLPTLAFWFFYDSRELFCVDRWRESAQPHARVVPYGMRLPVKVALAAIDQLDRWDLQADMAGWVKPNTPGVVWVTGVSSQVVVGVYGDNLYGYERHRAWAAYPPSGRRCDWHFKYKAQVRAALDCFVWPGADDIYVCGCDGVAFTYKPEHVWPTGLLPLPASGDTVSA